MTSPIQPASAWLHSFLDAYYARRPVSATFIGVHEHDPVFPDLSEAGLGDTVSEMEALLASVPAECGQPALDLDVRLARGFLRTQLWEYGSSHGPTGNPTLYTGEAVFGVLSLFLSDYTDFSVRAGFAVDRLRGLPDLLGQARENVRTAPAAWTQRAIRECEGGIRFLEAGIPELLAGEEATASSEQLAGAGRLTAAATEAARAFRDHADHLQQALLPADSTSYAAGEEALDLMIRQAHFLTVGADEIVRYAEDEMAAARARLDANASDFGTPDPATVLAGLADLHPDVDGYLSRYTSEWDRIRGIVEENDLLTWPDFPIEYVPRPEWARAAAPYLYFLFYRSPAAYSRPSPHKYLVTPIDRSLSEEERDELLRQNNSSVILLNHVIHHGSVGHHVQNWHAFRAESWIGRMAGVDCASRTAMLSAGTMAEGWACYATDLMSEYGALTPLQEYAECNSRVRMCTRAIVDVRLHQGRMSFAEAIRFYQAHAGMSEAAATGEVTKNSMFPGGALMYLMGTDGIHDLRREMSWRPGFVLRDFHDRFLSFGSVPVALIAERMLEEATDG
jgi:Bacterial protein of unknown function (DUF885)